MLHASTGQVFDLIEACLGDENSDCYQILHNGFLLMQMDLCLDSELNMVNCVRIVLLSLDPMR